MKSSKDNKGFTLIELLVIIAIIGVMAGAVVVAINPLSKLNSAKLANVKTFSASVENALIISQVGKWSFDEESGDAKDTSGYGNDGTLVGGVTRQTSDQCGLGFGGCLKFDGAGYVNVGIKSVFKDLSSEITVAAWINPDLNALQSGEFAIVTKTANGGSTKRIYFELYNGRLRSNADKTSFSGKTTLQSGVWQHVVWTAKLDGKETLYLNGKVDDARNNGWEPIGSTDTTLYIGTTLVGTEGFEGLMDEVKIYNKALLSYQIQQLYAQGLAKHLLALK